MKTAERKEARSYKQGKRDINSNIEAIIDHVENNENCEFLRILAQFSKMGGTERKKFMNFAVALAE